MQLIAVVPAAGFATRLQPLAVSKEMLVVRGRPMIDHLAERLLAAAPSRFRVVTRPDKSDLRAHAAAQNWETILGSPTQVAQSVQLGLAGLADDDLVLVGFPDTIIETEDAAVRTVAALSDDADAALGLFHSAEPERGDVVELLPDGKVLRVEPKPRTPAGDLVWGLVAARAGPLRELSTVTEPGHLWDRWARNGRVTGVELEGAYLDVGTPEALDAVDASARRRPAGSSGR